MLTTFADLCELSRNRPTSAEEDGGEQVHSPREHFHAYLHSLDLEREALPESFRTRLARVLRHYGVAELDPSPALEEAVHRVFLAQQRATTQVPAVTALLERWLRLPDPPAGEPLRAVGDVLDRLVVATQVRFPAVGRPVPRGALPLPRGAAGPAGPRGGVRGGAAAARRAHREPRTPPDHDARIAALVASPQPLIRLLAQRFGAVETGPEPILEVLTRRYYRGPRAARRARRSGWTGGRASPATTTSTASGCSWSA